MKSRPREFAAGTSPYVKGKKMPELDDVTTSEVTDPETLDNDNAGEGAQDTDAEPVVDTPDGFAVRDAKIAEQAAEILTLKSDNQALRAHNYDLMMSVAPTPEPENSGEQDNSGGDTPRGVDDIFTDRG